MRERKSGPNNDWIDLKFFYHSSRRIANTSMVEDLILFRSSDAGHLHRRKDYDLIVPTCDGGATSVVATNVNAVLSSGFQYMKSFVR